jgi:hypothetical protein
MRSVHSAARKSWRHGSFGVPSPAVGTHADKTWTFTGADDRFTITHNTGLELGVKIETKSPSGGWTESVSGTLTTKIE